MVYQFRLRMTYQRTLLVTGVAALLAFLVFIPFTSELIVNVTAAYATILLFDSVLGKAAPLLTLSLDGLGFEETDDDNEMRSIQVLATSKNIGSAEVEDLECKYRVYDLNGNEVQNWKEKDFGDANVKIPSHGGIYKFQLQLETVEEVKDQQYFIEILMRPTPYQRHLTHRWVRKTESPERSSR